MAYIGDFRLGDTFDTKFCTVTTTGAPTQLAGSPVISAYPGNSTTQLTAGITLSVDFDSVTGLNNVRVVASGGNGYATATNYQLVITTGTVGGTSVVGYVVAEFSIEARSALMPTTAARTLDVSAGGEADAILADGVAHGGTLGSSTATLALSRLNITSQTSNTSAITATGNGTGHGINAASGTGATGNGITSTSAATNGNGMSLTGNGTGDGLLATGGASAGGDGIAAAAGGGVGMRAAITGNITGDLSGSVGSVTGAVGSVTGAVGSVTGNVGGNVTGSVGSVTGNVGGNVTGSVGSVASGGITSASFAAGAINAAAIATGAIDADALATDAVNEIADGVWDEQLSGHTTAGSAGKALSDAGSAGDPWSTALPGAYGAGTAGHIVGTALPDIAPGSTNGLLRGGTNAATSITTALTANIIGNITGNLSGSVGSVTGAVGSVTGAVGSVTGNVGGNVVGSVASVTGNVGGNVVGSVASVVAGVTVTTNNDKTGYALSSAGVDAILDDAVDGSVTVRQSLRLNNSGAGGKLSGAATTTVAIRDLADTKDRVTATVDADGNRTAVTLDLT
jgi:hypothetical protein